MLYQVDARGDEAAGHVEEFLAREGGGDEEVVRFARLLVEGALAEKREIDDVIAGAAQNWRLDRMALVDRNILRIAVFEMIHVEDIPAKVSINEAIELGKRFSTQQSGSFINGILDRIRRERRL